MVKLDEDVKKLFADMRKMVAKSSYSRETHRAEVYRMVELVPIETKNSSGETLLVKAAELGDEDLVRHLLIKGADIDGGNHEKKHCLTPLMAASSKGHVEIMKILINAGANLHASSTVGNALYYDVVNAAVEAARLLLTHGLKTYGNNRLTTPLHTASYRCDPDMLLLLIEHGADVSAVDAHGRTALNYAAEARQDRDVTASWDPFLSPPVIALLTTQLPQYPAFPS
jgi:ankyrin repeat protein